MDTVVSVTTEDFEDVIDCNKNPDNDGDSKKENEDYSNVIIDQMFKKSSQNRVKFTNLARESLRCDISARNAALIATATLIDVGLISKDDTSNIVDPCKVRREQERI